MPAGRTTQRLFGLASRWARLEYVQAFALHAAVAVLAFLPVAFLGRTLQAPLYENDPIGGRILVGRRAMNVFNIDLATPAFYEWPLNKIVGDTLKHGELPLWNPYVGAGTPLAAQYSARAFFPYQLLEDLAPIVLWDLFLVGRVALAGFGTYVLLRALGSGRAAGFLGGIFYMLSGSLVWFVNLEQLANCAMVLPYLLWSVETVIARRSAGAVATLGLFSGLTLLAGQPETALYCITAGAVLHTVRAARCAPSRRDWLHMQLRYVAAGALGLLLAAPLLVPFHQFATAAYHLHPAGEAMGVQDPLDLTTAVGIWAPKVVERPTPYVDFPDNGSWDFLGGYVGVIAWVCVILGCFRPRARRFAELMTFALLGFGIVLKNLGVYPVILLGQLPLFDQAWSQRWAGPVWNLAIAVAAALGAEAWRMKEESASAVRTPRDHLARWGGAALALSMTWCFSAAWLAYLTAGTGRRHPNETLYPPVADPAAFHSACVAGGALATVVLILAAVLLFWRAKDAARLLLGVLALGLAELIMAIPRGYPPSLVGVFSIGVVAAGLAMAWGAQRFGARALVAGACFIAGLSVVVDLLAPSGLPDRSDPLRPPPYVRFLEEQTSRDHARVMAVGGLLYPNYAGALKLYDVRFINALSVQTYQSFAFVFLSDVRPSKYHSLWFPGIALQREAPENEPIVVRWLNERQGFYSLVGVRYVATPRSMSLGPSYRVAYEDPLVRVYENPGAFPRAWIAHGVEAVASPEQAFSVLARPSFDPRESVAVEDFTEPAEATQVASAASADEGVSARSYAANRVVLDAHLARSGMVVLSDTFFPGWSVTVDGAQRRLYRTYGTFRGVWVGPGAHVIEFAYAPEVFSTGAKAFGLAAAICTGLWLWTACRRRRDRRRSLARVHDGPRDESVHGETRAALTTGTTASRSRGDR